MGDLALTPDEMRSKIADLQDRLDRIERLYGIKENGRLRPQDKDVVLLLQHFRKSMIGQGLFVNDDTFKKLNRPTAVRLLEQFSLTELARFIDWFWMWKPADRWWRSVIVNNLETLAKTLNIYLEVGKAHAKGTDTTVRRARYDERSGVHSQS